MFQPAVPEMLVDRHTDPQTNMLITILCSTTRGGITQKRAFATFTHAYADTQTNFTAIYR